MTLGPVQHIQNRNIIKFLPFFRSIQLQVLKETCAVFRHLILDDDLRVEFSESHKHAKTIAENVLVDLTHLLPGNSFNM